MKICVIGAGNIGTYLAAYISMKGDHKVWLHTTKPNLFKENVILIEEEEGLKHSVKIHSVTDNLEDAVTDSDYVLITYPSFMIKDTLNKISSYVKRGTRVGVIPGFGGKEYCIDELLKKGCIFFGTQRVPSIVRLEKYGEIVNLKQKNDFMKIAGIPRDYTKSICDDITSMIDIPCLALDNYLGITLSPSNPTMHPSRLYELFKDYKDGETIYQRNFLFYEEWGNIASENLLKLDEELAKIFKELNINNNFNPNDFEKIKTRLNVEDAKGVTEKIRTAPGFQGITSPMIKKGEGFIPDLSSRYFIEDIQFGLCVIKAFAELCSVDTPVVDKITTWGQSLLNKEYIVDGKLCGKDVKELIIPQNKGINNKEKLIKYYL